MGALKVFKGERRAPWVSRCVKLLTEVNVTAVSHMPTDQTRLIALARRKRGVTTQDAHHAGIHSQQITRLVTDGVLERIARGQYRLAERPINVEAVVS